MSKNWLFFCFVFAADFVIRVLLIVMINLCTLNFAGLWARGGGLFLFFFSLMYQFLRSLFHFAAFCRSDRALKGSIKNSPPLLSFLERYATTIHFLVRLVSWSYDAPGSTLWSAYGRNSSTLIFSLIGTCLPICLSLEWTVWRYELSATLRS